MTDAGGTIVPTRKRRPPPGWFLLGLMIVVGVSVGALLSNYSADEPRETKAASSRKAGAQPAGVPFTIGGRHYLIDLPVRCKRAENSSSPTFYCPPGVRSPQTIGIAAAGAGSPALPAPTKTLALGPGRTLTYGTAQRDGGSGGKEVTLSGRLTLGGATLLVTCSTQGELSQPPADWCLPHLRTIRAK